MPDADGPDPLHQERLNMRSFPTCYKAFGAAFQAHMLSTIYHLLCEE